MRAREFITERDGKIGKRRQLSTRGLHTFKDSSGSNTTYALNRIMMAVAATDGKTMPNIDSKSWVGTSALAAPYSQEEHEMLKMAYRVVGADSKDLNHGDLDSEELPSTNTQSPVRPFKGYPR
jgi:hypothetical protein